MKFDHVAISSNDIRQSVDWYTSRFGATVLYQDDTWAILNVAGQKLALVSPQQHPPHAAFEVTLPQLEAASRESGIPIDTHRDGTRGFYLHDPFGNTIELICYPPGQTVYDRRPS